MWKLLLGFAVFAVVVVYVLMKSGGDIDMSGEKHGVDHAPAASAAETAASAASAALPAASGASQ